MIRWKKGWVAVALVLVTALAAAGCANPSAHDSANESGKTAGIKQIVYGMEFEIEKINPILDEEQEIDSLLFRGLTQVTAENKVAPDLATEWSISSDQLRYTFTLRDDAKWSDGKPVTAEDVVFTLNAILDPKTNTPIRGDFSEISKVEAMGPHQVTITLKQPFPPLLGKLRVGIAPRHLLEGQEINTASFNQNPVGNGPFKVVSWGKDKTVTVERNELYYGPKPKLDRIVFTCIPDPNVRLLQLKTGEIDLAYLEPNQVAGVKPDDPFVVKQIETADYRGVMFNFAHRPFADPQVRRAMALAVDRPALVRHILFGYGSVAYGPLQKTWADLDLSGEAAYRPEEAKKLLRDAGWTPGADGILTKQGERLAFELYAPVTDPVRVALVQALATQLKDVGVEVLPRILDRKAIQIDKTQAYLIGWGSPFDPDDHTFRIFHSSQVGDGLWNFGAYRNEQVDEWLEQARVEPDPDKRKAAYAQFQQALNNDPAILYLVYLDALYGASKSITGIGDRVLGHHGYGIMWNIEEWDLVR